MLLKSIRRPTDVVPIKISLGSKEDNPEGGALYQWRSYLREHGIHADTPQPTPKIWSDSQNFISKRSSAQATHLKCSLDSSSNPTVSVAPSNPDGLDKAMDEGGNR